MGVPGVLVHSKRNNEVAKINHIMWEKYLTFSLRILALYIFLGYTRTGYPWEVPVRKTKFEVFYITLYCLYSPLQSSTLLGGQTWEVCSILFLRRCSHRYLSQSHAEYYFKYKYALSLLNLEGIQWFKGTFWRCKQDTYW